MKIKRDINIPDQSFFLLGPRGTGKSTLLKAIIAEKKGTYIDLLDTSTFLELSHSRDKISSKVLNQEPGSWVCINEIQKIPNILDEVHRLMENKRWKFILSGSSARKLRHGNANLLGGRAVVRNLGPFNSHELGSHFNLDFALNWGNLPKIVLNSKSKIDLLEAYVETYLKEEIKAEGIIRKLEPFVRFLNIAGMMNGQIINVENIARESKVKRTTLNQWLIILEDTLLTYRLASWQPGLKIREVAHPKLYWFDVGVARLAAGLGHQGLDSSWLGFALETHLLHEIKSYMRAKALSYELFYYRTPAGVEVDLIIQLKKKTMTQKAVVICLEMKSSKRWDPRFSIGLKSFVELNTIKVHRAIGIYLGTESLRLGELEIMPVESFLSELHAGNLIPEPIDDGLVLDLSED